MAHILIIDDDPDFCYALERLTRRMNHTSDCCSSLAQARNLLEAHDMDAVFLDVLLPDGNGLQLLQELNQHPSSPETIIITGAGNLEGAETAITNGAWDYISKSTSSKEIALVLKRALHYRHERLQAVNKKSLVALRRNNIIGDGRAISACLDQVAQSAVSDVNVVITGETGTGKELFAHAIHENSRRAQNPFIVVDCASLPETLAESILFGHVKGAFTGAENDRKGLIAEARGGTLFLDEIGELSVLSQKNFLRILQERKVRPVGSSREINCDFRLVAATNRNLEEMVADASFRKDLFFRLQSMHIHLPPLRKLTESIIPIATFHINAVCDRLGVERKGVSGAFFDSLKDYAWPGNVRELVNCLEQAVINAGIEPILFTKHLPLPIRIRIKTAGMEEKPQATASGVVLNEIIPDGQTLQEFRSRVWARAEQQYLINLMQSCNGKIQEAIQTSGLSQSRLYALLKKYNITH